MADCNQIFRLEQHEKTLTEIGHDVHEIRQDFDRMDDCIQKELQSLNKNMSEFSASISGLMIRMEERDRRLQDMYVANKETFERFGKKLDNHEERLRCLELSNSGSKITNQLVLALFTGLGGLLLWLLQNILSH